MLDAAGIVDVNEVALVDTDSVTLVSIVVDEIGAYDATLGWAEAEVPHCDVAAFSAGSDESSALVSVLSNSEPA